MQLEVINQNSYGVPPPWHPTKAGLTSICSSTPPSTRGSPGGSHPLSVSAFTWPSHPSPQPPDL